MSSSKVQTKKITPTESKIDYVQVEGLVVLRIIKHCQEECSGLVDVAQGVLLGLAMENRLEITNSFPFPRRAADDDDAEDREYQMEMMRHLRHVNVDHLHVGWYQSTHFGSYFNRVLLDSQYNYQSSIEESVVLIYDPVRTGRGFLSLKAYRLTPAAMALYQDGDFPYDNLKNNSIPYSKIFEELPVVIRNSPLINILQCELESNASSSLVGTQGSFSLSPTGLLGAGGGPPVSALDLGASAVLERNMAALIECLDMAGQETNKLVNYHRQLHKQQQAKAQYLQKRAQENAFRAEKGEPPLPEEDLNKLFKPIPRPPRLDVLLLYGQINNYCQHVAQFASQALAKLFLANSLQLKQNDEHI